jgi:hypothetical protein
MHNLYVCLYLSPCQISHTQLNYSLTTTVKKKLMKIFTSHHVVVLHSTKLTNTCHIFLNDLLPHIISVPYVSPNLQVHESQILLSVIVGNEKIQHWVDLQYKNTHTKFCKNLSTHSKVEKQIQTYGPRHTCKHHCDFI